VTSAAVCQWEAGKSYPLRKYLPNLAGALDTSVNYLLVGQLDQRPIDARAARAIRQARKLVANALGVDVSRVKIEIDPVHDDAPE